MSELDFHEVNDMFKEVVPYISPTKQDVVIFLRAVEGTFQRLLYQAGEAVGRRSHNEVPHLRGSIRRPVSIAWGDCHGTRTTHVNAQTLTRAPARSLAQLATQKFSALCPATCCSKKC